MTKEFSATDLPKRFEFTESQERLYAWWESQGLFHSEPDDQREPFTIVIPPPNVTGALHLGHALNNSLQDILCRYKRMQGFNVLWMPGTDHAGIATQAVVEKRLREEEGKSRHDLGRDKLVDRIWEWKEQYETRILGQLKQIGASCDWERTRFTLDEVCARAVRKTFFDLFQKDLIYRGKRLVNWDTFLQTAVSDDEVFHETKKGNFWHFKYPVIDPKPGEPTHVTIATTRPETMLGDTAVAVHPDPAAALSKVAAELQEKLALANDKEKEGIQLQIDAVHQRQKSVLPQLEQLRDMANDGRKLLLPLVDREIPLVADEWAKPELGSGCVKITPAHDPNDYEVGRRVNLPMINILHRDGTLNNNAGDYKGLSIPKARKQVIADLEARNLMVEIEDREIELAHSDRSKTPIEPFLADQWFVRMGDLAQSAMDAVSDGRVTIRPARYAKGYHDWLAEKRDWPVSRQLWWGHQIPIWSKDCADETTCEKLVSELKSNRAILSGEAAFTVERRDGDDSDDGQWATVHVGIDEENDDLEAEFAALGFIREEDVLDTWFSSALWPHSTLGWPEKTPELDYYYPTNALITSRDIITLWVARMVLMGLNNMGDVPFNDVYIHPKILDGYGETMSKSKGNGVDPLDVIQKFGADALRFGLAHLTTETQDVRMPVQYECPHCESLIDQTKKNRQLPRVECSKCKKEFSTQWASEPTDKDLPRGAVVSERFELARNFTNKLWNASRFVLMNLEGYTPGTVSEAELAIEDRWLLSRLATVTDQTTQYIEEFRYADATRTLYDFAWDEFCSFYIEMSKDRVNDPETKPAAQRVLAYALDALMRLLHPFVPFITEEVWSHLGKVAPKRGLSEICEPNGSILTQAWPSVDAVRQDKTIETRFARFQSVLSALREIRNRQNISPRQEIEFSVKCDSETVDLLKPMEVYFESMAWAKNTGWGEDVVAPATNATTNLGGIDVYVDLKDFIDVDAEITRKQKEREKLAKMIGGKESKLSQASFVEKAPANIVQRERDSLRELKQQLSSVEVALAELEKRSQA